MDCHCPHLLMREQKLREVKFLAQSHKANKKESQNSTSFSPTPSSDDMFGRKRDLILGLYYLAQGV